MVAKVSGYDQLAADDIAAAMGRVQAQLTWCLRTLHHYDYDGDCNSDFYNAVYKECTLLQEYWVKLRNARNKLIGDDAVAF